MCYELRTIRSRTPHSAGCERREETEKTIMETQSVERNTGVGSNS